MDDKEYQHHWFVKRQAEKELNKIMSDDAKALFKKYVESDYELQNMEYKEQFEIGFRKGAKFTCEAFYNKRYSK